MMRIKGGCDNTEHERLMAEDRNDDVLASYPLKVTGEAVSLPEKLRKRKFTDRSETELPLKVLLNIGPAVSHPEPAPPYSASIPMQSTTTVRIHSAPGHVHVTAKPIVQGSGSVFVLSQPIKPDPHCCLSFFSFILCPLFGCVACLFTCSTKCENDRNDLETAKCRSACACGWGTVGIVCGLIGLVILAAMAISGLWIFAHVSTSPVVVQALSEAIDESIHESNREMAMADYGKPSI